MTSKDIFECAPVVCAGGVLGGSGVGILIVWNGDIL